MRKFSLIAVLVVFFVGVTVSGTLFNQTHNVVTYAVGGSDLRQVTSSAREVGLLLAGFTLPWLLQLKIRGRRVSPVILAAASAVGVILTMGIMLWSQSPAALVACMFLRNIAINVGFESFKIVFASLLDAGTVLSTWGVVDYAASIPLRRLVTSTDLWTLKVAMAASALSLLPIFVFGRYYRGQARAAARPGDVIQGRRRGMSRQLSTTVVLVLVAGVSQALVDSNLEGIADSLGWEAARSAVLATPLLVGQLGVNAFYFGRSLVWRKVVDPARTPVLRVVASAAAVALVALGTAAALGSARGVEVSLLVAGATISLAQLMGTNSFGLILEQAGLSQRWLAPLAASAYLAGIGTRVPALFLPLGWAISLAGGACLLGLEVHRQTSHARLFRYLRKAARKEKRRG